MCQIAYTIHDSYFASIHVGARFRRNLNRMHVQRIGNAHEVHF